MKAQEKKLKAMLSRDPVREQTSSIAKLNLVQKIDPIADKIIVLYEGALNDFSNGVRKFILMGELLLKQKKELPHGSFENWLKENILDKRDDVSRASIGRYMQLAKGKSLIPNPEKTTLIEALELIHNGNKIKEINLNPTNPELKKKQRIAHEYYKNFISGKKVTQSQKEIIKSYIEDKLNKLEAKRSILETHFSKLK
ncbi:MULTISPECIES: hypothetical protein [Leptospira]|uniref:PF11300 domain protein n=1 Tax=Leptospira kirschneri serovar Bulgarica str. Nikolaevo TaxID=1240687 RepID=M6FGU9_9LEPT|nr:MULTISPECIES: hypothetical protein [Leptospira]EMK26297.1 hypothetical protein LEP1GSC008_1759 [Leptospira kirschneri serovar Bulgarica str. Nikolaevo]KON79296.1 Uncharacterized protein NV38_0000114 [Leptospira kirschneri serovar Mozdok]KPZ77096.1 hypothetical protein APS47_12660 [Leptospira kirschneri serovar Mozdok]